MPSKELQHLRRTVEAAKKLVKKPVIDTQQVDVDTERTPQPPAAQNGRQ